MAIYLKQSEQIDRYVSDEWGTLCGYIEVGDDLRATRHVFVNDNGFCFRYDRENWADSHRTLGGIKYDEAKWLEWWGPDEKITQEEFERVWDGALVAPNQPQKYWTQRTAWPVLERIELGG